MKSILKCQHLLLALSLSATFLSADTQAGGVFPIATNPSVVAVGFGIASDGTNYLVGLMSGSNVCGQLVSPNGALIGPLITVGTSRGFVVPTAAVAFGRTNYLVVWSDASLGLAQDMFGQFISRSGVKVGSAFPLLQSPGTYGFQMLNAVAFDGTNFLVVSQDTTNINYYGQLVTEGGTFAGSEFLISNQLGNQGPTTIRGAAAFGQTNYLVGWGNHSAVYGALISKGGSAGNPFPINQTAANGGTPYLAFDGTNFLTVWQWGTNSGGDRYLYGRLVSPAGTFPGGEVGLITNANQASGAAALAFDGANYLMVWAYFPYQTNGDIRSCFLDRSLTIIGPEFTLFPSQGTNGALGEPNCLVFDGTRYVIAATLGVPGIGKTAPISGEVFGASIPASTARPRLEPTGPRAGTQFPLLLTGTPGINYAIQAATNLPASNWMPLVTNSPTSGPFIFTDTGATNRSRFYRAVKQ